MATQEAPSGPSLAERFLDSTDPRQRLLVAMALAIEEKGFAATTVADVVRLARVSRRTFYEHFSDRDDCFLALFDAVNELLVSAINVAASSDLTWREQLEAALQAYLAPMAAQPGMTRSFLFEIYSTGQRGEQRRRAVNRRFSQQLVALVDGARERDPTLNEMSLETATAITGGMRELAMMAAEQDGPEGLDAVRRVASELISDVLTAKRD